MAKINVNDVDRFNTGGNNEFFALKKDKESAIVRFLYDDEEDLDLFAVHEVQINGKKRYVSCLDNGHCPLCKSGNTVRVKLFLQLFVDGEVKTWERGKTFLPKILGYFDKYGPLINRDFEIVRHGKPNSTDTVYELYPLDKEDITLEEFLDEEEVEKQDLDGTFVLNWDEDEMEEYLDGGDPTEDEDEEEPEPRSGRRSSRSGRTEKKEEPAPRSGRSSRKSSKAAEDEDEEEPVKEKKTSRRGADKEKAEEKPKSGRTSRKAKEKEVEEDEDEDEQVF